MPSKKKEHISPVANQTKTQKIFGKKSFQVCFVTRRERKCHMGVSKNRGTPKWMIYNGTPY